MAYVAGSRIWIAEFGTGRVEAQAPMARIPALVHQPPIDLSSPGQGNKKSNPFSADTRYIRVISEVPAQISILTNGVGAQASAIIVGVLREEYFGVNAGDVLSVSAL